VEREPSLTVRVKTDQPRCLLVFVPMGSGYDLSADDEVVVHVYGRAGPDAVDVEVMHEPETILLWLGGEYRAWNKAGAELSV
jgi:hypothetical protein